MAASARSTSRGTCLGRHTPVLPAELVHDDIRADLSAGFPCGLDQHGVEQRPARAVERVDALVLGIVALHDGLPGVEPQRAGRRRAACRNPVEQPPSL